MYGGCQSTLPVSRRAESEGAHHVDEHVTVLAHLARLKRPVFFSYRYGAVRARHVNNQAKSQGALSRQMPKCRLYVWCQREQAGVGHLNVTV